MRKRRFGRLAALVMALACLAMLLCGASFDIPSDSWVMDDANILSAQTEQYVNERTKVLSDACGAQIGVATVEYTGSLSVEDYAYQLANEWGLGDSKKNNGVLLLLVPVIGVKANGARRWLGVGGLTVQPSELAKLAVILSFSALICRLRGRMATFRYGILPFAGILLVIIALLVLEPHFSASVIIIAIGGAMLFLGGVRIGWFAAAFGAVGAGVAVLLTFFPYASSRINTWRDPFSSSSDEGYQIVQSLYSIGSGGLSGLGLGGSRQKFLYLPEEHNDFIFSVVCEELGFIGAALILVLFALLILRGYWIALHSPDRFSFLVCAGVTTLLAIQVFLNVAVVTNLVPCTGISLPFFSYGGTALLIELFEMGIVLSASRDILTY